MKLAQTNNKLEFMTTDKNIFAPIGEFQHHLSASIGNWYRFQDQLTNTRATVGVTQGHLARQLGVTQPAVSVFENSNSLATQIETIISYAAALGMEVEFSLKKTEYPDLPESGVEEVL